MAKGKDKDETPSNPAAMPAGAYAPPPPPDAFTAAPSDAIEQPSSDTLHDLFSQQMRTVLDSSDLDDEEKQSILVAMNCPCCGAGGASFSVKMRRRR